MHDVIIKNLLMRAEVLSHTNWLHAINILEKASEQYPRERGIYLTLGDIYAKQKKQEQAIGSYQQALTIDPNDEHLLFTIGNCYMALSEYRMALVYFAQVSKVTPELLYNRALAYTYSGQHEECVKNIKELLKYVFDNLNVYYFLVEELLRLSQHSEALVYLNEIEKRFGTQRHQLTLKGFVYNFQRIWLKSYVSFKAADEMRELNNIDHLHPYAMAAWHIGQLDKAVDILNRAVLKDPYASILHEDIIRILIQQESYHLASLALERANKYLSQMNPVLLLLKEKLAALIKKN